jgi:MFS family permease
VKPFSSPATAFVWPNAPSTGTLRQRGLHRAALAGQPRAYVGRRPVLVGATVTQVAGLVVLSEANGLRELIVGRILQGLATGAAAGAVGAGMLDIDQAKGTLANATTPSIGSAIGGAITGTGSRRSGERAMVTALDRRPARLGHSRLGHHVGHGWRMVRPRCTHDHGCPADDGYGAGGRDPERCGSDFGSATGAVC